MATPKKFFKYTKAGAAKTILDKGSLQWSSPTLFNDPFDMQFDLHLEYDAGRVANRVVQRFLEVYTGRADRARRHSRRSVSIRRSAYGFCHGDLGEIGRSRIPIVRTRFVKLVH